jgi:NHL repeat-containing protein
MGTRRWSLVVLSVLGTVLVAFVLIGRSATDLNAATGQAVPGRVTQEIGGQEEFGPYDVVHPFPQPLPDGPDGVKHDGWTWGSIGGVFAETPDKIWIALRGELPLPPGAKPWTPYIELPWKNLDILGPPSQQPADAPGRKATGYRDGESGGGRDEPRRGWEPRWHHQVIVVDRNGKMVEWWQDLDNKNNVFDVPRGRGIHKIKMSPYDPEKHVWIIDDEKHMFYKFTRDGKLVQKWGELGVKGRDGNHFNRPTDIDWLPDGTFFITDGYGGKRVAKFDKTGKFLMDWGQAPKDPKKPGPNEFNTPHSIAISKDRRLFVSDRSHKRIQVFDENGKFLFLFSTGANSSPYTLLVSGDQYLWVGDGGTQNILKYDLNGHYLYSWGRYGTNPGGFYGPHQMTVDQDRNFYTGDVFGGRVNKFRPKPNADPAKVMQPELKPPMTSRTQ